MKEHAPINALPPGDFHRLLDERLRVLIERARLAPFYQERLVGITDERLAPTKK